MLLADSSPRQDRPAGIFSTRRLIILLCLLGVFFYLKQSGQGQHMVNSIWAELQLSKAVRELGEGNTSMALERLEAATEASERHRMHLRVGMVYSEIGLEDKALTHFVKAVASNPRDADAYCQQGNSLLKLDRVPAAVVQFGRALELRPNDPLLMNNIGYAYTEKGIQLDEAEGLIEKAVKMMPQNGAFLDSLGWVYFKQGKLQEALEYLQKAHKRDPDNAEIKMHLGKVQSKVASEKGQAPAQ